MWLVCHEIIKRKRTIGPGSGIGADAETSFVAVGIVAELSGSRADRTDEDMRLIGKGLLEVDTDKAAA